MIDYYTATGVHPPVVEYAGSVQGSSRRPHESATEWRETGEVKFYYLEKPSPVRHYTNTSR